MWKQVASKELEERGQHADLDGLISGYGDPAKVGYMCRKCFYSYEKLLSTQATLELKVKKAIDAIASVPTGATECKALWDEPEETPFFSICVTAAGRPVCHL